MSKQNPISLCAALNLQKAPKEPQVIASNMIDDMKVRDTSLKLVQNLFKLAAVNTEDGKIYDQSAATLGMGRRLIRVGRWFTLGRNLTKNLYGRDTVTTFLQALHHFACIMGCLCEDLTTLDKLSVLKLGPNAQFFEKLQKYSTFTEALTGFALSSMNYQYEKARFAKLKDALNKGTVTSDKAAVDSLRDIHFHQNNMFKWGCEIVSQSANLPTPIHNSTNISIIAAILSASNGLYVTFVKHMIAQAQK